MLGLVEVSRDFFLFSMQSFIAYDSTQVSVWWALPLPDQIDNSTEWVSNDDAMVSLLVLA